MKRILSLCLFLAACGGGGDVTYEPKVGDTFNVHNAQTQTFTAWTYKGHNRIASVTNATTGVTYLAPATVYDAYRGADGSIAWYNSVTGALIQQMWIGENSLNGGRMFTVYNTANGWGWFSFAPATDTSRAYIYWGQGNSGGIVEMSMDMANWILNGMYDAPPPNLQWDFGTPPGPGTVLPCVCQPANAPYNERDILATIPFSAERGEATK